MNPSDSIRFKALRLRVLEQYAYQIAFFLVNDEALAEEAAKLALLEISRSEGLLEESIDELKRRLKKMTIKAAFAAAAQAAIVRQRQKNDHCVRA